MDIMSANGAATDGASGHSRFLIRLLDPSRKVDYVIAFAIGAWPILLARLLGAHDTVNGYVGYWDRPNWWSLAILFPALLYAFRWIMGRIAPVRQSWPAEAMPPIVGLVHEDGAKQDVYTALRAAILSNRNVAFTFLVVVDIGCRTPDEKAVHGDKKLIHARCCPGPLSWKRCGDTTSGRDRTRSRSMSATCGARRRPRASRVAR